MAVFMKMLQKRISFQTVSKVGRLSRIPRVIQSTSASSSRVGRVGALKKGEEREALVPDTFH